MPRNAWAEGDRKSELCLGNFGYNYQQYLWIPSGQNQQIPTLLGFLTANVCLRLSPKPICWWFKFLQLRFNLSPAQYTLYIALTIYLQVLKVIILKPHHSLAMDKWDFPGFPVPTCANLSRLKLFCFLSGSCVLQLSFPFTREALSFHWAISFLDLHTFLLKSEFLSQSGLDGCEANEVCLSFRTFSLTVEMQYLFSVLGNSFLCA